MSRTTRTVLVVWIALATVFCAWKIAQIVTLRHQIAELEATVAEKRAALPEVVITVTPPRGQSGPAAETLLEDRAP